MIVSKKQFREAYVETFRVEVSTKPLFLRDLEKQGDELFDFIHGNCAGAIWMTILETLVENLPKRDTSQRLLEILGDLDTTEHDVLVKLVDSGVVSLEDIEA